MVKSKIRLRYFKQEKDVYWAYFVLSFGDVFQTIVGYYRPEVGDGQAQPQGS